MPISCNVNDLTAASICYQTDEVTQKAIMIYLMYQIAGSTDTLAQLVANSACYAALSDDVKNNILAYLSCAAASAAGA